MSEKREKARLVNWGFKLEFLNTTFDGKDVGIGTVVTTGAPFAVETVGKRKIR